MALKDWIADARLGYQPHVHQNGLSFLLISPFSLLLLLDFSYHLPSYDIRN